MIKEPINYMELPMLKALYAMGGHANYKDVFYALRYQIPFSKTQLVEHDGAPNYYRIAGHVRKNLYMSGLIEEPRDRDGILRLTDRGRTLVQRLVEYENMLWMHEVVTQRGVDVSSLLDK